jgi:hypothetical protein
VLIDSHTLAYKALLIPIASERDEANETTERTGKQLITVCLSLSFSLAPSLSSLHLLMSAAYKTLSER